MELKEAIEILKKINNITILYGGKTMLSTALLSDTQQAIDTVLKELNNRIPRKDIEDKIEELDVTDNAEAIEDIMYRKNYTITETIQMVLKEFLNNDKNSEIDLVD